MSGEAETQRVGFESIEWINKKIHWLDEFILSISTLLIGLALMLAFADLGTGGLIFKLDALLIGWGVAVGLGVESQLRALVRRAYNAFRERAFWRGFGWTMIAAAISAVSVIAMVIFSTEKILNLSESAALNMVGISAVTYAQARAVLSVALVIISGIAAYEMKVAKPDTETALAQMQHERTLLPHQIELDRMRAERAQQLDALRIKRMGNAAVQGKHAIGTVITGRGETSMALAPVSYEQIVDADTDDGDDDPTPPAPPRGPRGPRNPGRRGRPNTAMVYVPQVIEGMEYARPTSPLGDRRVNEAKKIIAAAPEKMTLAKLAEQINVRVPSEKYLSASNASKIQAIALQELALEGKLPSWAEKLVVREAAVA